MSAMSESYHKTEGITMKANESAYSSDLVKGEEAQ